MLNISKYIRMIYVHKLCKLWVGKNWVSVSVSCYYCYSYSDNLQEKGGKKRGANQLLEQHKAGSHSGLFRTWSVGGGRCIFCQM